VSHEICVVAECHNMSCRAHQCHMISVLLRNVITCHVEHTSVTWYLCCCRMSYHVM